MKSKKTDVKIKKEMLIGEVMESYPQLAEILMGDYGLHCIGCMGSGMETLEQGAMVHGMSDKEIDKMVEQLNKLV